MEIKNTLTTKFLLYEGNIKMDGKDKNILTSQYKHYPGIVSSQELLLWGKESQEDAFPATTILSLQVWG